MKKAPTPASFKPGQSGNPSGRPKRTKEELDLIAACKERAPQALDVLMEVMTNGENERNRITAAVTIIERAYGKPVQATLTGNASQELIEKIERVIVDGSKGKD